jgi:alpha/beta superfamily hydrolase
MGVVADDWVAPSPEQFLGQGPEGHEEIEFFGAREAMFGCRHMPASGTATAGVVVCSPVLTDAAVNHHREVRIGRWLARAGLAAQRFQYRGTGESDGDPSRLSFSSLLDDARAAATHLREHCGVEQVGFLGTRVGALVASRVARDFEGAPLALWQPVVDPRRYLDDCVAVLTGHPLFDPNVVPGTSVPGRPGEDQVAGPPEPRSATSAPLAPGLAVPPSQTGAGRAAAFLGSPLGRELFDPSVIDNIVDAAGVRPRPVLLVQLHRRVGLAPEYRAAIGRWQARECTVDVAYDPTEDDWWNIHHGWSPSDEALAATASWLSSQLAEVVPRPVTPLPTSWTGER